MTEKKIGQLVDSQQLGVRDAFHVPCIAVTCDLILQPGDSIKFVNSRSVVHSTKEDRQAIADPFVEQQFIHAGTGFWAMLVPGMVTNLTHHFDVKIATDDEDEYAGLEDNDEFEEEGGWGGECAGCD